jgi:L-alanine-DL-glutamate epimerase-like enolase superfamily enzyme
VELLVKPIELRLKYEFKIARGGSDKKNIFLIKISSKDLYGLGEITPYPYYGQTKELVNYSMESIQKILSKRKIPKNIADIKDIMKKIMKSLYGGTTYKRTHNHILSAVSSALIDLYCKKENITFEKFISEYMEPDVITPKYPLSSYTLGIDSPQMLREKIEDAKQFKILKVKLGASFEQDMQTINTLREITELPIRVDANCGWTLDETVKMGKFLEDKNIEFIEQPIPSDNSSVLDLPGRVKLPIIFDESIITVDDIEKNAAFCSGINIKLSKCGGVMTCLDMIKKARELDLKVMLGCMIETSVGINFGYGLSGLVDFADLDGNILITEDPFGCAGNFKIKDGLITKVSELPGIGIDIGHLMD